MERLAMKRPAVQLPFIGPARDCAGTAPARGSQKVWQIGAKCMKIQQEVAEQ